MVKAHSSSFQVYSGSWGDMEGIIKCHMEEVHHYDLAAELEPRREAASFNRPTKGTSVEKFREMVLSQLRVRGSASCKVKHFNIHRNPLTKNDIISSRTISYQVFLW